MPSPGWLVMISASGCRPKHDSTSVSNAAICPVIVCSTATIAVTPAPYAAVTGAGSSSCSARSVARIWVGAVVEVALPAGAAQHADHPGPGQRTAGRGGGRHGEHGQSVPAGEVVAERDQRGGVELPQHRPQLSWSAAAVDQIIV